MGRVLRGRPLSPLSKPYTQREAPVVRVVEGPLFSEVVTHFQHFQQTVCIHNVPGVEGLSLDVSVLVDIRDQANKELAMRVTTDIQSEDTFYTDLNGFQVSVPSGRQLLQSVS